MKRKLLAIILAVILIIAACPMTSAFSAPKHDSYMMKVLFGNSYYTLGKSQAIKDKVQMLEDACYLTIDQVNDTGQDELKFLKQQKVSGLPKLEKFKLKGIFSGAHRKYTHMGWEYAYGEPGKEEDKASWNVRKGILTSTVNKAFNFGFWNELFGNVCEKNDSFSALLYYVHILGDHLASKDGRAKYMIPFARKGANEDRPDVFYEIEKYAELLFADQSEETTYKTFIQKMDRLAKTARKNVDNYGNLKPGKSFSDVYQCEEDLMDLLISYMPDLLKNEEFFSDVFYP